MKKCQVQIKLNKLFLSDYIKLLPGSLIKIFSSNLIVLSQIQAGAAR
jgi:hypothetical protein